MTSMIRRQVCIVSYGGRNQICGARPEKIEFWKNLGWDGYIRTGLQGEEWDMVAIRCLRPEETGEFNKCQ